MTNLSVCLFTRFPLISLNNGFCLSFSSDRRGNRILLAICSVNIGLYISAHFFYKYLNARRERIWNTMSKKVRSARLFFTTPLINLTCYRFKEQIEYLHTTQDKGNARLDFRFAY